MSLCNLVSEKTIVKVSSTAPQTSKKSLLTGSQETCWTSTSLPASVHLIFPNPIPHATHLSLSFQGGFVGTIATVYVATKRPGDESGVQLGLVMGGRIYPEDKNKRQVFRIPYPRALVSPPQSPVKKSFDQPIIVTERPPNPNGNGEAAPVVGNGDEDEDEDVEPDELVEIKIEFEKSSDDYGRVTLYQIEVLG